jgi:hypothetical protein
VLRIWIQTNVFLKTFFYCSPNKKLTFLLVILACGSYFGVNIGIGAHQGEGTQPPSLLSPPGTGSVSCVTLWRQSCHTPPPSPTLQASCEIADSHPNQTICPTRNCCEVLTEIAGQPGSDFCHRGERVHRTQYTYIHCTNI